MMTAENLSDLIDEAARLGAKLAEARAGSGHRSTVEVASLGADCGGGIRVALHWLPHEAFNALVEGAEIVRGIRREGTDALYDRAKIERGPVTYWLFSEDYAATAIEAA